jgi:hypothetical protein
MFSKKEIKVRLSKKAGEVYDELKRIVEDEKKKGVESSFHKSLFRSIERAIELLKENPFNGEQVRKRQIPDKYKKKYDVENLWRFELAGRRRGLLVVLDLRCLRVN